MTRVIEAKRFEIKPVVGKNEIEHRQNSVFTLFFNLWNVLVVNQRGSFGATGTMLEINRNL